MVTKSGLRQPSIRLSIRNIAGERNIFLMTDILE